MNTLVIAAHMDDEAISCGGLLAKRVAAGGKVGVLAVYGRVYDYGRHDGTDEEEVDFFAAKKVLGYRHHWLGELREGEPHTVGFYKVLELVEGALASFKPDEVVIPSASDLNQDHRHLNHVCQIALRAINLRSVTRVLEFAALDGRVRASTYYVALKRSELDVKVNAINCYRRERRGLPSPRAPENVEAQARVLGAASGTEFAEAYVLHLWRE
jgi:LmbE family N-acetylglucosaminyl deacetylase